MPAGLHHHPGHGAGEIEPLAIFEPRDHRLGRAVMDRHCAGGIEARWIGDSRGREHARPEIMRERRSEPGADRV